MPTTTNAREDVNTEYLGASHRSLQVEAESARIDDAAIVEGPITPAMEQMLIFDMHASVRTASTPYTRSQSALRIFAIRLRRLSDARCACLRWRPCKTAALLVIYSREGQGCGVLRDGRRESNLSSKL